MDRDREAELRSLASHVRRIVEEADLFLDTETTDRDGREVVEIGIVDRNGNVLLQALVRPAGAIHPGASAVHGIDARAVAHAATWPQLWPALRKILEAGTVACYNANFDRRAIVNACNRHNVPWPSEVTWYDVMVPFATWYGEWNDYHQNYRYQKLSLAVKEARLDKVANTHRAVDDAEACRQVLYWLDQQLQAYLVTGQVPF